MRFLRAVAAIAATTTVFATPAVRANDPAAGTGAGLGSIDLKTMGVQAPTVTIGTSEVKAGTLQYSNSGGSSDSFSVGTSTSISASASASSTPDYNVQSTANFGVDSSAIKQVIGTSGSTDRTYNNSFETNVSSSAASSAESAVERDYKREGDVYRWRRNGSWETTTKSEWESARQSSYDREYNRAYQNTNSRMSGSGVISGSFAKSSDAYDSSNEVTVRGIGADNTVTAAEGSAFTSDIIKGAVAASTDGEGTFDPASAGTSTSAGTASGSASGNVGTTASANASSTQFVSSFVQAY